MSAMSSGWIMPSPVRSGREIFTMSVNTPPGLMRCTRTPFLYSSAASAFVKPASACLDAE